MGRSCIGPIAGEFGFRRCAAQQRHRVLKVAVQDGVVSDHGSNGVILDHGRAKRTQAEAPTATPRYQLERHRGGDQTRRRVRRQ